MIVWYITFFFFLYKPYYMAFKLGSMIQEKNMFDFFKNKIRLIKDIYNGP